MARPFSSIRSPIPVSTRTRPPGVSMSRQLRAWSNRFSPSISSTTSRSQRSRGTGPNNAPASERNVPAWTSATRTPPPRSRDQSTDSFGAIASAPRRLLRRRSLVAVREVAVERRCRGLRLALVLRPELRRPVRPLDRRRHLEERDLPDLHRVVERDWQIRNVRQLQREVALPARVDVAGGRVDEQPEAAERAVVRRNERARSKEDASRRRDLDTPHGNRRHLANDVDGTEPVEPRATGLLTRELARQPENRTIRRELHPVLWAAVTPIQSRATGGLDRPEPEARGELDDSVCEPLVHAGELAPP